MKKVQISKDQEIILLALKTEEHYNMVVFIHDNNADINFNSPFSKFKESELALIWMGHYEIKKTTYRKLLDHYNDITASGMPKTSLSWHEGFKEGLMYAIKELKREEGNL